MINPVAPFYEFLIRLWDGLPIAFSAFVSITFVCYLIVAVIQIFWSSR